MYCFESDPVSWSGLYNIGGLVVCRTMMWQAYRVLEGAGAEGLSQQQLGLKLGQGKLEARTICRNLLRRTLVVTVMKVDPCLIY